MDWQYRPESNDIEIIDHVYNRNGYRLPDDMKDWFVIDVGAHIGAFSVAAAERGAIVKAHEPASDNFRLLELNTTGSGVDCIQCAVGPLGKRKLYLDHLNTGQNSEFVELNRLSEKDYEWVEFYPLASLLSSRHCDLLKLDCEGGEVSILEEVLGGLHILIDRIAIEFHFFPQDHELRTRLQQYYSIKDLGSDEYYLEHT